MAWCPEDFRERERALVEFVSGGVARRRSDSGSHSWLPELVYACTPSRIVLLRMVPVVMQVKHGRGATLACRVPGCRAGTTVVMRASWS